MAEWWVVIGVSHLVLEKGGADCVVVVAEGRGILE